MQIHGPSQVHGAQSIQGPRRAQQTAAPQTSEPLHGADQVDISAEADMVSRVHELPDVRTDKVAEIRQQIDAGTYDTDAKMEVAVGRLLDELSG